MRHQETYDESAAQIHDTATAGVSSLRPAGEDDEKPRIKGFEHEFGLDEDDREDPDPGAMDDEGDREYL